MSGAPGSWGKLPSSGLPGNGLPSRYPWEEDDEGSLYHYDAKGGVHRTKEECWAANAAIAESFGDEPCQRMLK